MHDADPGGWTPLLVLGGATCCLGSALQLMISFCNDSVRERYNVQLSGRGLQILWSAIVSVFLLGGVSGSLIASWLSDRFGRKVALRVGNICGVVGAVLFLLVRVTNSVELFLIGRVIVGKSRKNKIFNTFCTNLGSLSIRISL